MTRRDILFEVIIPLAISIIYGIWGMCTDHSAVITDSLSFLRILLGFTMATMALFLTKNPHVDETKDYLTDRKLQGNKITLYKYIILSFAYLIISETIIQIAYFIYELSPLGFSGLSLKALKLAYIFLFFHILFATVRVITETYFVLIRK